MAGTSESWAADQKGCGFCRYRPRRWPTDPTTGPPRPLGSPGADARARAGSLLPSCQWHSALGSSENSDPVPAPMASTTASILRPPCRSISISAGWPLATCPQLGFLEVGLDPDIPGLHQREQALSGGDHLARFEGRGLIDHAIGRRSHHGVGTVISGLSRAIRAACTAGCVVGRRSSDRRQGPPSAMATACLARSRLSRAMRSVMAGVDQVGIGGNTFGAKAFLAADAFGDLIGGLILGQLQVGSSAVV